MFKDLFKDKTRNGKYTILVGNTVEEREYTAHSTWYGRLIKTVRVSTLKYDLSSLLVKDKKKKAAKKTK